MSQESPALNASDRSLLARREASQAETKKDQELRKKSVLAQLEAHRDEIAPVHMRALFASDPSRPERYAVALDDLTFDFSRQILTDKTLGLLLDLANAAKLPDAIEAMYTGDCVNRTEGRAALHPALRAKGGYWPTPEGECARQKATAVRDRVRAFIGRLRAGLVLGATGSPITDIVSLGVGGSDLGPFMAARAFDYFADGPSVHFIANVDGIELAETLRRLHPSKTLILVASKSFSTLETLENAKSAREWLTEGLGEVGARKHFLAATVNVPAALDFGVPREQIFEFWDWVGGRFSIWSSVGLTIPALIGWRRYEELLEGAAEVDRHFREAPLRENIPALLALIGVWNRNLLGHEAIAICPYDHRLRRLPSYLQQLEMESNGKRTTRDGGRVGLDTAPVLFGEPGTNAQHSFFQLLHQGSQVAPADFFVAAKPTGGSDAQHALLVANCFAQAEALAIGLTEPEARETLASEGKDAATIDRIAPHMACPGDRPTNLFLYRQLEPRTLGRLIAIYEHKVFAQGVIWNVESFDQWGVELGKRRAKSLTPLVRGDAPSEDAHPSVRNLVKRLHALRNPQ
ncbi:MAG: glucose-6-phosphate isomerase [Neomegalonema sp.]